ncbi:MAG: 1-(5-phosphoribosyl)-5-((5-phosphoribosylamino)methylideneamino)imidazole-4-carboxamide isomerase [Alkalibacterium sp.]|nr:1-(5-phosphoribosyl)-5-((5-phosphoribosylamino)methylideneamino)imidazole-4-carboxamide isomerase [Alkalibacterium sp.]TVP91828.1 MAG: 1-(5-phosphoribosyl)-5-((5-phosphoribosylamino)methylideneamino)imidazole-4-carboxamide isomerase [Alkalibacterium sp.]
MIELWPAIDLINNQSVRLTEGDYATEEKMARSPHEAIAFYNNFKSVKRIHIVDLMGALKQTPAEKEFIKELIQLSDSPVEIGGGIRSRESIEYYLESGAEFVIVGTRGLKDLKWLTEMTSLFPGKIYLGLDAKKDQVAVNGWTEDVNRSIFEVAEETAHLSLGGIIYTDISKDGKMEGPNFQLTQELVSATPHPVTASGGIRSLKDMQKLEEAGVKAAIVGKAANTDAFWEGIK